MAFSTNYSGRSSDLLIFQGVKTSGDAKLSLSFGTAGSIVTGVEKVAQTFTKLFLTDLGSAQYHPDEGSGFIAAARRGALRDESEVQVTFSQAAEKVRRTMGRAAEKNNLPDDERLDKAELLRFNLDKAASKVILFIRVLSVAGTERVVYLPVPVAIP